MLISPVQILGAKVPNVRHQPHDSPILREKHLSGEIPPFMCCSTWGRFFLVAVAVVCLSVCFLIRPWLCFSYQSLLSFVVESGSSHLAFSTFSQGNDPYLTVDLVYLWEKKNSESSYTAIMGPPLVFITDSNNMVLLSTYTICRFLRKTSGLEDGKMCLSQEGC